MTYSGPSGTIPETVTIDDSMASERSISVSGTLMNGQIVEAGFSFITSEGRRIMLGFVLICTDEAEGTSENGFPAGKHMVPFGGEKSAVFTVPGKRKEDEDA